MSPMILLGVVKRKALRGMTPFLTYHKRMEWQNARTARLWKLLGLCAFSCQPAFKLLGRGSVISCLISPTSILKDISPFEAWFKVKPDVSNLTVFGCKAFARVPGQQRKKLNKKSVSCVFVGYPNNSKGYKLFSLETRKIVRSRDVISCSQSRIIIKTWFVNYVKVCVG